ncbi:MAG: hypothetical protein H0X67_22000 [Acidobacteria bacterium]|nr:hypothetical protein [Acidobacteriota bacterium]
MDRYPVLTDVPELATLQQRALLVGAIGLLAGVAGAVMVSYDQFLQSWLIGFWLVLGLSLGSLGLLMLQHMTGGQWGLMGRRIWEAGTRNVMLTALLFLPIALGTERLFIWAQPEVLAGDPVIQAKAAYLNVEFFLIRAVVYFAFWIACAWVLTRWSDAQERGEMATVTGDTVRFRKVSAPGLLFFVLTISFASVDWMMSLDPHWFSTIYGLTTVAGQGLSALAFAIAVLALTQHVAPISTYVTQRHFHDLGKLLLAFVMLWAYLNFSQFLIIWSGNLPEEIPWYIVRFRGGWEYLAILLVVGHFALPFMLLLSRDLKRNSSMLAKVAIAVLVMRLIDLIWLISPAFAHGDAAAVDAVHHFPIHWMDIAIPVGLLGLWIALFARNLRGSTLLPLNDPYFKEAFVHEAH